jgi:hypothetical protein
LTEKVVPHEQGIKNMRRDLVSVVWTGFLRRLTFDVPIAARIEAAPFESCVPGKSDPQALKRDSNPRRLSAQVKLVPFPALAIAILVDEWSPSLRS